MIEAFIISFAILLNKSLAQPMAMPDCPTLMYSPNWAGIPSYFPGMVAHGVHSMTLPDIDFYFPNNKSDISMPVVNPDLISTEPILFNPPNFEHSFETPAMRVVDLVLSHMNSPHWDITLETDLEKLVHAAHMQDVWYYAGLAYEEMKKSPTPDEFLCSCIRDVENNGVLDMLRLIALKVREPKLMYKGKTVYPTKPQNGPMDKIVNENWDKPKALPKDASKKDAQIYDNWDTKYFVEEGSAKNVDAQIYDNWDDKFFVKEGNAKKVDAQIYDNWDTKFFVKEGNAKRVDAQIYDNWDTKFFIEEGSRSKKVDAQIYDNWDTKFFVEEGRSKKVDAQIYDNWDTKFFVEKGSAKTGSIYNQGQRSENSYHFVTEVKEEAVDENETLQKKPYPHLNDVKDWEFWKASMMSMKPNMKNYSNILALYMYCHLQ